MYRWLLFYVNYPRCRVIKGYRRCLPSVLCDFCHTMCDSDSKIGWFRRCLDVLEPLRISKGLLCVHMYYIMCIKSEQFIVYTLIVGRFHDQASPKTDSRLPNDAGSCYDASASPNSNNSNSLQLWTLDTEARNSQEDLAERSNIGSEFFIAGNQHPCRCRVVRKPLRLPVQLKP